MSSRAHKKQPISLNFSEENFPNVTKHFQNTNQRITQNQIRARTIDTALSTIDSRNHEHIRKGQDQSSQRENNLSQTLSCSIIHDILTNVEPALVDKMEEERPRRFSQPSSTSQSRFEREKFAVQSQQKLALNNPEVEFLPYQTPEFRRKLQTLYFHKKKVQKRLVPKPKQIKLPLLVPENVNSLNDIPLSQDQRRLQESYGRNSTKKPIFKRFQRFKIALFKVTYLKHQYFQMTSSVGKTYLRGEKSKNADHQQEIFQPKPPPSEEMNKIHYAYSNIDMPYLQNEKKHYLSKVYCGANEEKRRLSIENYIKKQIRKAKTFIFLVEAYTKQIRSIIREVVRTTRTPKGQLYYYPEHLDLDEDRYATIILSKVNVRFGRIQFQWGNKKLPEQAFCQFQVLSLDGQNIETVCLMCCHWKSNRGKSSKGLEEIYKIRQYQKECCYDLCRQREYYIMLLIGDTNLENQETLQFDQLFIDTYFQSKQENVNFALQGKRISKYKGTQLLLKKQTQKHTIYVRPDRVLVNKSSQDRVRVKTKIQNYFLQGMEKQKNQELIIFIKNLWRQQLHYICPSDHYFLVGAIYI